MLIIMGAVLSVLNVNSKVQAKKTAMDNLNFALESMERTIRFGTKYHCDATVLPVTSARDCGAGASSISVLASDGTSQVTYALSNGALVQTIGGNTLALTSPEVTIQSITFWVLGAQPYGTDNLQPRVTITISAIAGSANKAAAQASFKLETTVSQRKLDI